ncbi:MAG: ABC transporter permease [Flavobacteriales bacterium]|nr:ABC transporter permease [Flavobacteriales bacterium]
MNKIWLIIKREYLVRVRKKSFIIMTFLAPLLMAGIMIVPLYLANENQEERVIAVSNQNKILNNLEDTESIKFSKIPESELLTLKQNPNQCIYYAIIIEDEKDIFTIFSKQQISVNVKSIIQNQLQRILEHNQLKELGINVDLLEEKSNSLMLETKIIAQNGKDIQSNPEISMGIGFMCGILIYIFIFMYGTMVMRGVIEEKTNRIIEVIISSVKPFQLMLGKIIGVALVGITQFTLWVILTITISAFFELNMLDENINNETLINTNSMIISEIYQLTSGIDLIQIINLFIFYFLSGYLLYSSLFAAVGSAVDSEADTQQFILPVTIPLILSFILMDPVMDNPSGSLAFWMSIIPFTSPVIMMVRLPFGIDNWEIILSMSILIISFLSTTFLAAKVYRVGILMYGKKATYKEIFKWLKY